jgi:hypothetical protein
MKDILEFISVLTVLVLTVAVAHEWGFFFFVGRQFQALMTPSDYFSSVLGWLPSTMVFVFLGWFLLELPDLLSVNRPYVPGTAPRIGRVQAILFPVLMVILFLAGFLFFDPYLGIWIIFGGFVLGFIVAFVVFRLNVQFIAKAPVIIGTAVFYITMSLWQGLTEGRNLLQTTEGIYAIRLKDDEKEHHLVLLRNFSSGILVRDPLLEQVLYYKWDQVAHVGRRSDVATMAPLICKVVASYAGCPPPPYEP